MQSPSVELGINPPFDAYAGEGPYTFISYAHADKVVVFDAMRKLKDSGANIWYDEGIKPAGEWVEEIARAIKSSSLFLVFISPRSVDSRYVKSEVGYALSENKEILTLIIEETTLPAGLALCLQQFQSISINDSNWEEKATRTILDRMDTPVLSGSDECEEESEVLDHGKILWDLWDKSRDRQIARLEKVLSERPKPQKKSSSIRDNTGNALQESKDFTAATRHPFAVSVEVEDTRLEVPRETHKDSTIGEMQWVSSGDISVKVPYSDECKKVRINHGFWMAKYLITQEVYSRVMGNNPSFFDSSIREQNNSLPVNNVSWLDAVSFCKALTNLTKSDGDLPDKYEFRLPTEVEWEYSCRAGTKGDYYFGDFPNELQEHAWFKGNSQKRLHPVGLKKPNPWGLYDMYGNVREWVGNSFANTLLNESEQDEFRISRGGAYMKIASECQSSSRSTNSLNHRFRNLGFRPILARVKSSSP